MATPFENFVNIELPKRIATNDNPLTVQPGKVPVTTGVGLLTEFQDYKVDNNYITITASLPLSGHRIVTVDGYYADCLIPETMYKIAGLITSATASGALVNAYIKGEIVEPSWNWEIGKPVFLGSNGLLTQDVLSNGYILKLGIPKLNNTILLDLNQQIIIQA